MSEVPVGEQRVSLVERLSDRCNPILLRELQQMFGGKVFNLAILLMLLAVFLVALGIALQPHEVASDRGGRDVFIVVLMVLTPVLTLVLPMQAFNSMQFELREGSVDQLLMSDLKPRQIVRGKLQAAALVIFAFLGAFAPLLAVTYLLRGIDVTTIALVLAIGTLSALAASSVGMAMGAVTAIKPLQQLARVGVSLGLGVLTIASMAGMYDVVREVAWGVSRFEWQPFVAMAVALLLGIALMQMIAAAVLTHPYENRSTPFRVLPFAAALLALGMIYWMVEPRYLDEVCPAAGVTLMVCGIPFAIAAVTEAPRLSPRVRTMVPRNRLLALLSTPFLPGGDRGYLFFLLLVGASGVLAGLLPWLFGILPHRSLAVVFGMTGSYLVIYLTVMRALRGDGTGARPRIRAIIGTLLILVLAIVVPLVVDLARHGGVDAWSWPHLFNPFYTIDRFDRQPDRAVLAALGICAAICVLLRVPGMLRGLREVMEASRARAS